MKNIKLMKQRKTKDLSKIIKTPEYGIALYISPNFATLIKKIPEITEPIYIYFQ
jgi:hypothetical protein